MQALLGEKEGFLTKARLGKYDGERNNPNADAVSGLSAYFHFGQLAPQRAALEAGKHRKSQKVRAQQGWNVILQRIKDLSASCPRARQRSSSIRHLSLCKHHTR